MGWKIYKPRLIMACRTVSAFVPPSWILHNPPDPRLHWEVLSVWICNCYFFLICGLWMIRWKKWKNQKLLQYYWGAILKFKNSYLTRFAPTFRGKLTSDSIKIKPNTVVFYYCLWFDFYCIGRNSFLRLKYVCI